ncbi:hypothetical protein CEXT_567791 [Caerostris extrusa]|uniref:Uncharacterized protein n=1 Tax=Caerostris extrusa TaxID=172846 RepID=A0AAV4T3Z3_CAEEX|nr:hypothetical protein CEXT_567791 [Caerostris extrusa]
MVPQVLAINGGHASFIDVLMMVMQVLAVWWSFSSHVFSNFLWILDFDWSMKYFIGGNVREETDIRSRAPCSRRVKTKARRRACRVVLPPFPFPSVPVSSVRVQTRGPVHLPPISSAANRYFNYFNYPVVELSP